MSSKATIVEANKLVSKFAADYKEKTGHSLDFNRYKDKWAMRDLIVDFGKPEVEKTIDYYIRLAVTPSLKHFYANFDRFSRARKSSNDDHDRRMKRREALRKMMEEDQ